MDLKLVSCDTDFLTNLEKKGKYKKANAYLVYSYHTCMGIYNTSRTNAKRWKVSNSTAHEWAIEFNHIMDELSFIP